MLVEIVEEMQQALFAFSGMDEGGHFVQAPMDDAVEEGPGSLQPQAVLLLAQDHQQFALGNPVKIVYLQALVGVYENILHRPLEHSCRRAHRVVPVDVAVHEIVGEHQRLDGGDPLARDRQPPPFGVVLDGLDESVAIDGVV